MPVYVTGKDVTKRTVVVVHEGFGLNAHIRDVADRLAGVGYRALAPNFFYRSGGGTAPYGDTSPTGLRPSGSPSYARVLELREGLTDAAFLSDLDATVDFVGATYPEIATVGFCMGGRFSFLAALRRRLGAAATFYGGGIVTRHPDLGFPPLVDETSDMQTPWVGFFGDRDAQIPPTDVEYLRAALSEADGAPFRIVRYPDAGHGFHCDARDAYHVSAAADAWSQMLRWFQDYLE
jgi:carboxymethylenebutenolidase